MSSIPLIFLAIAAFWIHAARSAASRGDIVGVHPIFLWLALLAGWGVTTAMLAVHGSYRSSQFYGLWPGFWVPLAPVALSMAMLAWPRFRTAMWIATRNASPRAFLFVHALRILAVGGIYKAMHGLLPGSFVYPVGIPDFAYGFVSLAMAVAYPADGYSRKVLIGWNLAGMAVLLAAPILMQLGLPGPIHVFRSQPDARALFEFPMVLAPTLVVTWLFFMNGWHALVLWRSRPELSDNPIRRNEGETLRV